MNESKTAIKFIIPGRLDGLNDYTAANRRNPYAGSSMKSKNEKVVKSAIRQAKLNRVDKYPVHLKISWYEKNARRDVDNIMFGQKFILDALVKEGILENDSQKYVRGISHVVQVDKDFPRIEVLIYEERDEKECII